MEMGFEEIMQLLSDHVTHRANDSSWDTWDTACNFLQTQEAKHFHMWKAAFALKVSMLRLFLL